MNLCHFCKIAACLAFLLPGIALAQTEKPMELDELVWKKRVLLLFAPDTNDASFVEQKSIISKNAPGIRERDLVVMELVVGGREERSRQALLRKFKVPEQGYTLILLGKDGQEKFRSQQPVPMRQVFEIIDQMPMRRQEMRKQE